MGITVNWNGTETTISSSNAYAIYEDWVQGEIDLSTSQIKMCESFLTDEEIEEIEYENGGDEKTGAAALGEDAENAENSSGQGGNAAGTTAVSGGAATGASFAASAAGTSAGDIFAQTQVTIKEGVTKTKVSPMALVWGGLALVVGVLVKVAANAFDSDYDNRTQARDNADSTNSTLDGYTSSLEENFDAMNEDADAYAEATDTYTTTVNDKTSQLADLQVQLQAAQAAGDTAGAESIQSQIDALNESEVDTEEMDEIQEKMAEYQSLGSEAGGAAGAGQSVSDFLKTGTVLGAVATVNALMTAAAAILTGVCASKSGVSWKTPFELPIALAAAALFVASGVLMASAAVTMASKAKNEFECGSAGSGMQGHVNTLNDMIGEHSEYMDATTEAYDETDAESQESQQEAAEAAAEVTANGGTVSKSGSTSDDEDEKKTAV